MCVSIFVFRASGLSFPATGANNKKWDNALMECLGGTFIDDTT